MTAPGCDAVRDLIPEVGLDVAGARDRALVLAHTEGCPECRRELAATVAAAEQLATLTPTHEPPPGFDRRVMAALAAEADELDRAEPQEDRGRLQRGSLQRGTVHPAAVHQRPVSRATVHRHTRWARVRRPLVAAAAAVALLAGIAGWAVGHAGATHPGPAGVAAAPLHAGPDVVGRVLLAGGDHPWLAMAVRSDATWGAGAPGGTTVRCQVQTPDGTMLTVGTFALTAGSYGYWSAPVPPGTVAVGARLVDALGGVIATASFPAVHL